MENKKNGDAFRDEIAAYLESLGYVITLEANKKTPLGWRRVDLEVVSPTGELLGGIECKTGYSPYLPRQRAKDLWLGTFGDQRYSSMLDPTPYYVQLIRR